MHCESHTRDVTDVEAIDAPPGSSSTRPIDLTEDSGDEGPSMSPGSEADEDSDGTDDESDELDDTVTNDENNEACAITETTRADNASEVSPQPATGYLSPLIDLTTDQPTSTTGAGHEYPQATRRLRSRPQPTNFYESTGGTARGALAERGARARPSARKSQDARKWAQVQQVATEVTTCRPRYRMQGTGTGFSALNVSWKETSLHVTVTHYTPLTEAQANETDGTYV